METWLAFLSDMIVQPTRFQQGQELVAQRWDNLLQETGWAVGVAAVCVLGVWAITKRWLPARFAPLVLIVLFLVDVGRVNSKFMLLQPVPSTLRAPVTPTMEFVKRGTGQYRALPMNNADPMTFVSNGIPVMFTSNPVQMWRWQMFLENFNFGSGMPDFMNIKYLIYDTAQYEQEKAQFGNRFVPVYRTPDGKEIVLENRQVLPKGWLVPSVVVTDDVKQIPGILGNPAFNPRQMAVVESPPPIPLAPVEGPVVNPGTATVATYENITVTVQARALTNALLVLGDKYFKGWRATIDGKQTAIVPVNLVLRGVYVTPGDHTVEFIFDPLPFKIGKWLTLSSFLIFALFLVREVKRRGRTVKSEQ
jgi:hypothetical protein